MLEAHGVGFSYKHKVLLQNITLPVVPGEVAVICGPNGAGKSTLLHLLAGDLPPSRGIITLDGEDIVGRAPEALAMRRAVLEQNPSISGAFTVHELAALGTFSFNLFRESVDRLVDRALGAVSLRGFADRQINQLSGGERARAHLARVLVQIYAETRVSGQTYLLLDEPTASLDPAHQITVLRAARECADDGVGVLMVCHDLTLSAASSDRVHFLKNGSVMCSGAPRDVFTPKILKDVYDVDFKVFREHLGAPSISVEFGL
ncbi:MAG: ATP-binding cassette domain-containing protein [Pseudomonadota bacterium]